MEITSYFWANYIFEKELWKDRADVCNIVTYKHNIDTWLWLLNNLNSFLLWQFAIIYIFWPKKINVTKQKVNKDNG